MNEPNGPSGHDSKNTKEHFRVLSQMMIQGDLDPFHEALLKIWPPESAFYWNLDDITCLNLLFRGLKNIYGEEGIHIYRSYEHRLKFTSPELSWNMSLKPRSEIVEMYEGFDKTITWLENVRETVPPPNDGIVDLVKGEMYMLKGKLNTAKRILLKAVNRSMRGIDWYRAEALNAMANCLVKLGEYQLAFEYSRAQSMELYKRAHLKEPQLIDSVRILSLFFGQLDYYVSINRNLAKQAREQKNATLAATYISDSAFRLAQLGVQDESLELLLEAARDAGAGWHPNDPYFCVVCQLLKRYMDVRPLGLEEMHQYFLVCVDWGPSFTSTLIDQTKAQLTMAGGISCNLLEKWKDVCKNYVGNRTTEKLVTIHALALLAKYYRDLGYDDSSICLYNILLSGSVKSDAIFYFCMKDYVALCLANSRLQEAAEQCDRAVAELNDGFWASHEIFTVRLLAAQVWLGLGDTKKAFSYAKLALFDWKLVLQGLYEERYKLNWLEAGVSCINIAIKAISQPAPWISEQKRRRELFALMELGKARTMSDKLVHQGYMLGVFTLSDELNKTNLDTLLMDMAREHPTWYPPLILQLPGLHCDFMSAVQHDFSRESFPKIVDIDIPALRSLLHFPLSAEKRLFGTAESLLYDQEDDTADRASRPDLLQRIPDPFSKSRHGN